MSIVQIDWHPDGPALKRFGRTVIIGSLLIAAAFWFLKGWGLAARIMGWSGLLVGGLALMGPRFGRPGYLVWMGIAFVMGNIVSRVVLAIVYYLVLTPIGLVGKLVGRDRLAMGAAARSRDSHWVDLPRDRAADDHDRQF